MNASKCEKDKECGINQLYIKEYINNIPHLTDIFEKKINEEKSECTDRFHSKYLYENENNNCKNNEKNMFTYIEKEIIKVLLLNDIFKQYVNSDKYNINKVISYDIKEMETKDKRYQLILAISDKKNASMIGKIYIDFLIKKDDIILINKILNESTYLRKSFFSIRNDGYKLKPYDKNDEFLRLTNNLHLFWPFKTSMDSN